MGLDGGTIISRSDVLRGASWEVASADDNNRSTRGGQVGTGHARRREKADARCAADSAWTTCSLSGEPLRDGEVVACELGRLYNKHSVVEHLLALRGETQSEAVAYQLANRLAAAGASATEHLRSVKSVFPILLTREGGGAAAAPIDNADEMRASWQCPVSGALTGRAGAAFVALRPCGHVLAARVLASVPQEVCLVCDAHISSVVALNYAPEEEERLRSVLAGVRKRKREAKRTADA